MSLAAFSSAAIIALASTLIFVLIIKSWDAVLATLDRPGQFSHCIMREAAQRFRDEMQGLGRQQSHYLVAVTVCLLAFLIAWLLPSGLIFGALPEWQLIVALLLFAAAILFTIFRLVQLVRKRQRLAFVMSANMATGHALQKLTANQNRVFHDVHCGTQIIDNVVVGLHGIYAVSVIALPPGKDKRVRLRGDELSFASGNSALSVAGFGNTARKLAKELGRLVNHEIRVRSVIAVPGWEIESQRSDDYLVVNERNLPMLTGWRDDKDFLMNEDVAKIHQVLTERCSGQR